MTVIFLMISSSAEKTVTKALQTGVVLTIPAAGSEGSNSAVIQKEINGKNHKTRNLALSLTYLCLPLWILNLP